MGRLSRPAAARRGVTLVEMLVTVAVLVIIMTDHGADLPVGHGRTDGGPDDPGPGQPAQAAGLDDPLGPGGRDGAVHAAARPGPEPGLFRVRRERVRRRPGGRQRRLSPVHGQGPARPAVHGADVGQLRPANERECFYNATVQPITITSEYAEIIYFLRNGNLYRRVLLIAPELQIGDRALGEQPRFLPLSTAVDRRELHAEFTRRQRQP